MKKLDEVQAYLANKREIYEKIVNSIDSAIQSGAGKIYLKDLKFMEETVDAFANSEEWPDCLKKAKLFFESTEEYELCQVCKDLLAKIEK